MKRCIKKPSLTLNEKNMHEEINHTQSILFLIEFIQFYHQNSGHQDHHFIADISPKEIFLHLDPDK